MGYRFLLDSLSLLEQNCNGPNCGQGAGYILRAKLLKHSYSCQGIHSFSDASSPKYDRLRGQSDIC